MSLPTPTPYSWLNWSTGAFRTDTEGEPHWPGQAGGGNSTIIAHYKYLFIYFYIHISALPWQQWKVREKCERKHWSIFECQPNEQHGTRDTGCHHYEAWGNYNAVWKPPDSQIKRQSSHGNQKRDNASKRYQRGWLNRSVKEQNIQYGFENQ